MEKLYDRIILLICSSIFLLSVSFSVDSLIAILVIIFFSSLITCFNQDSVNIISYLAYSVLCFFYPSAFFLFPVMSYDLICAPYKAMLILGIANLVMVALSYPLLSIFYILALTLLSYFLRKRTLKLEEAQQEYTSMRDTLVAMTKRLRAQNRDLLEKQDYEIKNATLDERNRIARDIHDTVGHLISSSLLQIGALLAICKDDTTKAALTTVKDTLSTGMDNIRASIHNIHEDSLDLELKLKELCHNFTFCETELIYNIEHDFSMRTKYSLISITKEALSNVMKHSSATLVTLSFAERDKEYEIKIQDNGKQIFLPNSSKDDSGMGLNSIRERIEALDGHFHIDRSEGFMIYITIPKSEAASSDTADKDQIHQNDI